MKRYFRIWKKFLGGYMQTEKQIIVIGAVSENGVYGEGDKIPWYLPEDFKHFKELTMGHTVVMGKGTWESLPPKFRPLPNRCNIIVSKTLGCVQDGVHVAKTLDEAVAQSPYDKVFCIGGAGIWYEAMEIAGDAWITKVFKTYPVTSGNTHTACNLVTPHYHWNGFHLKDIKRPVVKGSCDLYFEIYHWTRS